MNVVHTMCLPIREVAKIVVEFADELCGVVVESKEFPIDYLTVHENTMIISSAYAMHWRLVGQSQGAPTRIFRQNVSCLTTLPCGAVVGGTHAGNVVIWDSLTKIELQKWGLHQSGVHVLLARPNGILMSASKRSLVASNLQDGTHQVLADYSHVTALAVSRDGRLIIGQTLGRISIMQDDKVIDPKPTLELRQHTETITAFAVLHNGLLLSGSLDSTVRVWDPCTGAHLRKLDFTSEVWNLAVLLDGRFVTGCDDEEVIIWDQDTFTPVHKLLQAERTNARQAPMLAVLQDGKLLFHRNNHMTVWR